MEHRNPARPSRRGARSLAQGQAAIRSCTRFTRVCWYHPANAVATELSSRDLHGHTLLSAQPEPHSLSALHRSTPSSPIRCRPPVRLCRFAPILYNTSPGHFNGHLMAFTANPTVPGFRGGISVLALGKLAETAGRDEFRPVRYADSVYHGKRSFYRLKLL